MPCPHPAHSRSRLFLPAPKQWAASCVHPAGAQHATDARPTRTSRPHAVTGSDERVAVSARAHTHLHQGAQRFGISVGLDVLQHNDSSSAPQVVRYALRSDQVARGAGQRRKEHATHTPLHSVFYHCSGSNNGRGSCIDPSCSRIPHTRTSCAATSSSLSQCGTRSPRKMGCL